MKFTNYADLTEKQKQAIFNAFDDAIQFTDPNHAAAIAAKNGLELTDRQWNGKAGSNAYAAALACLVMNNKIKLSI